MAVQVATLDILTRRAHFDPEVARAIGDAIDVEMNASREALATKHDLREEAASLRREMVELRAELKKEMAEFKAEIRAEIASIRAEVKRDIAECKSDMIRWMFSAMLGQTMLFVGLMYFMLQHVR